MKLFKALLFLSTMVARAAHATPTRQDPEEYLACGCGCCGVSSYRVECLYRAKGDDIERKIAEDRQVAQKVDCRLAGCSFGILYRYCDEQEAEKKKKKKSEPTPGPRNF